MTLLSGSITQGMGHETIYKQLVCDRLGIHPDQVQYIQGDTDKVAIGEGSGGSRSATLGGSAVYLATEKIVAKAKAIAAHMLEAAEADIEFADGVFAITGTDRAVSLAEIAAEAWDPPSLPDGMEPGLVASAAYSAKQQNFPNGVHICELEIDPETGTVELLHYSVVDDVGTVLNPLLLEGQICRRHRPGDRAGAAGGHPFRRRARASSSPARSWITRCRAPTICRRSIARATRCRPRPTRSASRARAKPARSARCRRSATRWSMR